ncbi:MAG: hypothetical protein JKY48_05340, partial [Flavobacteriales bacterium]|nr:hypothetical protein [Flavobacteriales bacterium]
MKHQLLGSSFKNDSQYPLFQGCNIVNEEDINNKAVKGSVSPLHDGKNKHYISYIESTLNFVNDNRLNMSADISLGGLFGANGKVEFAKNTEINSFTSSILIYSKQVEGVISITEKSFIDKRSPDNAESMKSYVRKYGDSFISSASKAGVYWMMITFKSESMQEKEKVDTVMKANGIIKPLTIEGALESGFAQKIENTGVSFERVVEILGVNKPKPQSIKDGLEYAIKFLSEDLTSPIIADIKTQGYESLLESERFSKVASNRDFLTYSKGVPNDRVLLVKLIKGIQAVKKAYSRYDIPLEEINELE